MKTEMLWLQANGAKGGPYYLTHANTWTHRRADARRMPQGVLVAWVNAAQYALPKGTTELAAVRCDVVLAKERQCATL